MNDYRICNRCIMDTTDPYITFDSSGNCNHCNGYYENISNFIFPKSIRQQKFDELVSKIKSEGKGKRYNCVIGVSGGVDSTYTAYLVKEVLGLRPLAVHLDNGWNTELAVMNIENTLAKLNIDLFTHVINWEEFKDIQLAFLKASTPDSEIPTDHAINAIIYKTAVKEKIRYILHGTNYLTEAILPRAWSQGHMDWSYIRKVHRLYGNRKIKTYPYYTFYDLLYFKRIKRLKNISILNYIDYSKEEAKKLITEKLDWRDYGGKHYESFYTRFFQAYILPNKFGYDKRRAHLSTLICSDQISREESLKEMKENPYNEELLELDKEYVIKKLGISNTEFESIMKLPKKEYKDFQKHRVHYLFEKEDMLFNKIYGYYRKLKSNK